MVLCVLNSVLSWTTFSTPLPNQTQRYHIDASFCDGVRPWFRESALFTWTTFDCDDIRTIVRESFDAWQHNSPLSFAESLDNDTDILLSTSNELDEGIVGLARRNGDVLGRIELDDETCWYTDRAFCHAVARDETILYVVLSVVWGISLILLVIFLCRPLRPFQSVWRLLTWSVVIAVPLAYFGAIYPCLTCYDFASVMMHEIGHVIGLGHSDDSIQTCGCGEAKNLRSCGRREKDPTLIMHSVVQRRRRTCLSRDDADGVRTLYSGRCGDPVWCYESYDASGYTRILVALVYSFGFSLLVVGVRNVVHVCQRRRMSSQKRCDRPIVVLTTPVPENGGGTIVTRPAPPRRPPHPPHLRRNGAI